MTQNPRFTYGYVKNSQAVTMTATILVAAGVATTVVAATVVATTLAAATMISIIMAAATAFLRRAWCVGRWHRCHSWHRRVGRL